jgi:hypothetical protein
VCLTITKNMGKLRWAHGRDCSPVVKSRWEASTSLRGVCLPHRSRGSEERKDRSSSLPDSRPHAATQNREPVCAWPSAAWISWLCESGSVFGCY